MSNILGFGSEQIDRGTRDWFLRLNISLIDGTTLDVAIPRQTAVRCFGAMSAGLGVLDPGHSQRVNDFTRGAAIANAEVRPSLADLMNTQVIEYTVIRRGDQTVGLHMSVQIQNGERVALIFDHYAAFVLWEELDQARASEA